MRKVQVQVHVHVQTSAILVSTDPSISHCYYRDRFALFRSAFAAEAQDACVD
ncbi:hypothetical protein Syun_016305 [Stephania yunnanensis]|uniref:Uncharacterized protein n=1 Tax=Stephania yunnanensis TaxID=152371 RepID=A0AAP0P232_9MAGN